VGCPRSEGHCTALHSKDQDPAPGAAPDGEQRSTRASVRIPAPRRAAHREGVGPNATATASGAARGSRSARQRYREGRCARKPSHRLVGGGVVVPPGGGVDGSGGEGRLPPGRRVPGWGGSVGGVRGRGPPPPRYLRPRHNHLSSKQRTNDSLFRKVADSDSLGALLLFRRRFVSPERLPYGQISAAQTGKGKSEPRKRGKGGRHGQMSACYRLSWIP